MRFDSGVYLVTYLKEYLDINDYNIGKILKWLDKVVIRPGAIKKSIMPELHNAKCIVFKAYSNPNIEINEIKINSNQIFVDFKFIDIDSNIKMNIDYFYKTPKFSLAALINEDSFRKGIYYYGTSVFSVKDSSYHEYTSYFDKDVIACLINDFGYTSNDYLKDFVLSNLFVINKLGFLPDKESWKEENFMSGLFYDILKSTTSEEFFSILGNKLNENQKCLK